MASVANIKLFRPRRMKSSVMVTGALAVILLICRYSWYSCYWLNGVYRVRCSITVEVLDSRRECLPSSGNCWVNKDGLKSGTDTLSWFGKPAGKETGAIALSQIERIAFSTETTFRVSVK